MSVSSLITLSPLVIIELLKFYDEMRTIYGDDVTPEQVAEAWQRSSVRYQAASDAWRDAPPPSG